MISHAEEIEVFTPKDLELWQRATKLVAAVKPPEGVTIRCHELARAVGTVLNLPYSDGSYQGVEHTWLRLGDWKTSEECRILDVYVPGVLPQVQLIHYRSYTLPWHEIYRQGVEYERHDINVDVLNNLIQQMWDANEF